MRCFECPSAGSRRAPEKLLIIALVAWLAPAIAFAQGPTTVAAAGTDIPVQRIMTRLGAELESVTNLRDMTPEEGR